MGIIAVQRGLCYQWASSRYRGGCATNGYYRGAEGPDPNIMKWIGKGNLATIDYDASNGNKPRLKLKQSPPMEELCSSRRSLCPGLHLLVGSPPYLCQ